MSVQIVTDHKWKQFKYRYEVPENVLKDQFEHLEDELVGFFKYRHYWYHISDFMRITQLVASNCQFDFMSNYDGYHSDSFFSGVLIKISNDCEEYKVATYYS